MALRPRVFRISEPSHSFDLSAALTGVSRLAAGVNSTEVVTLPRLASMPSSGHRQLLSKPDAIVQNAAEVTTQGVELDGRWAADDYVTLSGAVAYLDAKFDSFDSAPCAVDCSTPPSSGPVGCDASGMPTAYAPEWSGYLAVDIVAPIGNDLQFLSGLNISYSDEFLTDSSLAAFLTQPSYTRIDARIGIAHSNGHWDLVLIGNNLSDELILNNGMVFVANAGYLKTPRRISLQGTYRFGR